jgi:uncharacterized membrane protein
MNTDQRRQRIDLYRAQRERYLRDRTIGIQGVAAMESKAKILGHPVHPMLIVFPLGLLATAVIFDAIYLIGGNTNWLEISYWMIAAGLIGGLVAAVPGLIDWLAIPSGTRAKGIGLWHAIGNVVVLSLFGASWWLRRGDITDPGVLAFVLAFMGVGVAMLSGWLGGELVDRLGVGVDRGAHLNSPNALSGRPAHESDAPDESEPRRAARA